MIDGNLWINTQLPPPSGRRRKWAHGIKPQAHSCNLFVDEPYVDFLPLIVSLPRLIHPGFLGLPPKYSLIVRSLLLSKVVSLLLTKTYKR